MNIFKYLQPKDVYKFYTINKEMQSQMDCMFSGTKILDKIFSNLLHIKCCKEPVLLGENVPSWFYANNYIGIVDNILIHLNGCRICFHDLHTLKIINKYKIILRYNITYDKIKSVYLKIDKQFIVGISINKIIYGFESKKHIYIVYDKDKYGYDDKVSIPVKHSEKYESRFSTYSLEVDDMIFTCDPEPVDAEVECVVSIIYKDLSFDHHKHMFFTKDNRVRPPLLFDENRRLLFIHSSRGLFMRRIDQNIKLPSGKAVSFDYSERVIEPENVQKRKTVESKPKHVVRNKMNNTKYACFGLFGLVVCYLVLKK